MFFIPNLKKNESQENFGRNYFNSLSSLRSKGVYINHNLKRIQIDIRKKNDRFSSSDPNSRRLNFVAQIRDLCTMYQIMVNEIKNDMIIADLDQLGQGLHNLFMQLINIVLLLVKLLFSKKAVKPVYSPQDQQNKENIEKQRKTKQLKENQHLKFSLRQILRMEKQKQSQEYQKLYKMVNRQVTTSVAICASIQPSDQSKLLSQIYHQLKGKSTYFFEFLKNMRNVIKNQIGQKWLHQEIKTIISQHQQKIDLLQDAFKRSVEYLKRLLNKPQQKNVNTQTDEDFTSFFQLKDKLQNQKVKSANNLRFHAEQIKKLQIFYKQQTQNRQNAINKQIIDLKFHNNKLQQNIGQLQMIISKKQQDLKKLYRQRSQHIIRSQQIEAKKENESYINLSNQRVVKKVFKNIRPSQNNRDSKKISAENLQKQIELKKDIKKSSKEQKVNQFVLLLERSLLNDTLVQNMENQQQKNSQKGTHDNCLIINSNETETKKEKCEQDMNLKRSKFYRLKQASEKQIKIEDKQIYPLNQISVERVVRVRSDIKKYTQFQAIQSSQLKLQRKRSLFSSCDKSRKNIFIPNMQQIHAKQQIRCIQQNQSNFGVKKKISLQQNKKHHSFTGKVFNIKVDCSSQQHKKERDRYYTIIKKQQKNSKLKKKSKNIVFDRKNQQNDESSNKVDSIKKTAFDFQSFKIQQNSVSVRNLRKKITQKRSLF